MSTTKKVTVLMPAYNAEKYLNEAIDSILNQTYSDFDFLIINDGSNDRTDKIIRSYEDRRIKYLKNKDNIGVTETLNRGLDHISSEYIVRMDADDVSLPRRIEKQVAYMDSNPEIAVSGTWIKKIYKNNYFRISKRSCDSAAIKTLLLFRCSLNATIIRNSILQDFGYKYDVNHISSEDYGLWLKMSFNHKLGNIPEVLYKYRINMSGLSQTAEKNKEQRDQIHMQVYRLGFDHLKMVYSIDDLFRFRLFVTARAILGEKEIQETARFLHQLKNAIKIFDYDVSTYEKVVTRYFILCCSEANITMRKSSRIYNDYFSEIVRYSATDKIKFLIRRYPIKELKTIKKYIR